MDRDRRDEEDGRDCSEEKVVVTVVVTVVVVVVVVVGVARGRIPLLVRRAWT